MQLEAVSKTAPRVSADIRMRMRAEGRILIIDDNERASTIVARELSASFHSVDRTNSPIDGLKLIASAREANRPYDAIVLDLLMPEMNGLTLLTKLGDTMPAAVIHTASTMAPSLLHLESELSAQNELERVFVHHKTPGSLNVLSEKLYNAIELHSVAPGAAAKFFSAYRPRLLEREPGLEEVHNFCEEARNVASELTTILRYLRDEHRLDETGWWKSDERAKLEEAIAFVGGAHISRVWKATPGGTDSEIHDILNVMALELSAPSMRRFSEDAANLRIETVLNDWDNAVKRYYEICRGLRDGFNKHYSTRFYIEDFLPTVWPATLEMPNIHYFGDVTEQMPVIDPERRVRNFVRELFCTFNTATKDLPDSLPGAVIYFRPEKIRIGEELDHRAKLGLIDCGNYWEICISAEKMDFEKTFEKLAPKLSLLMENKEAVFEISKSGDRSYFSLYLKSSAPTINLGAEEEAAERELLRKKEDGSYTIPRDRSGNGLWVCEGLGRDGKIVCVHNTPQNRANEDWSGPVIYRYGDLVIYSDYLGHPISSRLIAEYICHLRKTRGEPLNEWGEESAEERVYREATRLNHKVNEKEFIVDARTGSEAANLAIDTLTQLGVSASNISMSRGSFAPKLDPEWFVNSQRIDRGEKRE